MGMPRFASRQQETQAQMITCGVLLLVFVMGYFNSRTEDRKEDSRIRGEVERLVRMKKEFEESEAQEEGTDDDSMAAALRAAQANLANSDADRSEADGDQESSGND